MDAPLVWILTSGLVPEKTFKQVLTQRRICVEVDRPRWEDDVDSVHVLKVREIDRISVFPKERPELYIPRCSKSLYVGVKKSVICPYWAINTAHATFQHGTFHKDKDIIGIIRSSIIL